MVLAPAEPEQMFQCRCHIRRNPRNMAPKRNHCWYRPTLIPTYVQINICAKTMQHRWVLGLNARRAAYSQWRSVDPRGCYGARSCGSALLSSYMENSTVCTGWPICFGKDLCWHQIQSSVTGLGHRINLQLNATSNLESTYLFPEADGPPCIVDTAAPNERRRRLERGLFRETKM